MTLYNPYSWSKNHLDFVILENKSRILDDDVHSNSFRAVDRIDFVPAKNKDQAYFDTSIDIGYGQRIERPTIVANLIKYLNPRPGERILEIGTGSGYMAALLGFIVGEGGQIISIDRILSIVNKARKNLSKYPELNNIVEIVFKDGSKGYPEEAPFDAILSSGYFDEIPEILKNQLKIKGKLVIPISEYELKIFTKVNQISIKEESIHGLIFDKIHDGVE